MRAAAGLRILALLATILATSPAWADDWKIIKPEGTGISVEMPGDPKPNIQKIDTAAGQIEIVLYVLEVPNGAFLVNATSIPPNAPPATVEERLDGAREGAVRNSKGELIKETKIMIEGHPGRQLLIKNSMGLFIHARVFVVDKKLVQTVAVAQGEEITPEITRFFDSLTLLKKAGNAGAGNKADKLSNPDK